MKRFFKKAAAFVVTAAILLQILPMTLLAAPADTRVVDPSTMTDWQNWFGPSVLNTENAGGVWGDKSVFLNADDFNDALENGVADYPIDMTPDGTNFLVALSAIAANKSIVGYSALPTDTMLVLDLSISMTDNAMSTMIGAANAAIKKLLDLNRNNRVGVVVYAGTQVSGGGYGGFGGGTYGLTQSATVLLELGRYTGTGTGNATYLTYRNDTVSVASGVLGQGQAAPGKRADGSTYIQAGMQLAVDEFKSVPQADTVINDGPQAGTVRMPIMVLMSDGEPTVATTSINNVGNSTHGNGYSGATTNSYLTQLTCAWAKKEMAAHYGRAPLFYTLGLNVGNSAAAQAVLNPAASTGTYATYWEAYNQAAATGSATVTHGSGNSRFTVPVVQGLEKAYVDQYFAASNDNALNNAFEAIVNQIIIQSKYYPTMVDDGKHHLNGYITFHDELGEYMQVRDIKGLTVDGRYYKGSALGRAIREGAFGNIYNANTGSYNLNNLNDTGNAFLDAIEERLGCTQSQARDVAEQALANKQLYYESGSNYSNYIGWYADQNGDFIGFWNGDHAHLDAPADAVYANMSYGFMGTVGSVEEFNESDMLHISVQVRENLSNQHQLVIYKIPASLIPTVNYNIEFDGDNLEDGENFEMSIDGATEALRLIFEVGLREDINRINVAEKVQGGVTAENGVYTFYSNRWSEHSHADDALVDDHSATWLEFEPSLENERYYFTANTPIYEKDGNTYRKVVDYDPANINQTYYSSILRFSTASTNMTAATKQEVYVPVTAQSLAKAKQAADGTWYIPKDTIHHLLESSEGVKYQIAKDGEDLNSAAKEHPTKTLDYSNYPQVVTLSDGTIHCDACLGNNGMFTMEAAQGIKLSKQMAVEGLGNGARFTFDIALSGVTLDTAYPVYDENGEYLYDADVNANVIQVTIAEGETVYIADLPADVQYTVTEVLPAGSPWMVDNAKTTGTSGTVSAHTFSAVNFVNDLATYGNLVLHKDVFLPTALGPNADYTGEFDVRVVFDGSVSAVKVDGVDTTVTGNTLDLKIRDNQTIVISNIPNGTGFAVSEPNLPSFWQSSVTYHENRNTISDAAEAVVTLENYYEPNGMEAVNVQHVGEKTLNGRGWLDSDEFTFTLQYFDGNNWVNYGTVRSVVGSAAEKTFSFTAAIEDFVNTHVLVNGVGVYQLRVLENESDIGGVSTDLYPKQFALTVENDFTLGKYKITDVTTITPGAGGTAIRFANNVWTVATEFVNVYDVAGTATVEIEITKQLEDNTGLNRGKAGFEFELYQLDSNNQKINVESLGTTDVNGIVSYRKAFGAEMAGQTLTYYIAEVDQDEDGMQYDLTPRVLEVRIVDNLDGSVSADINGQGNTYAATFTNVYALDAATLTVDGNKKLTGRDPLATDAFKFELYRTDARFENPVKVDTVTNGVGSFTLTDTIDVAGTYYYTVSEAAGDIAGITDDDAVYYLTVTVDKGNGDALEATIVSLKKDGEDAAEVEFENVYKAANADLTFTGTKTLEGGTLNDNDFTFKLYETDSTYAIAGVTATGEEKNIGGKFAFDTITYTAIGTHYYVIAEDATVNPIDGVNYDGTQYRFRVDVTDAGEGQLLVSVQDIHRETTLTAATTQTVDVSFVNTVIPPAEEPEDEPEEDPIEIPETGETSNLFAWFAIAFVSGAALFSIRLREKKSK